MNVAVIPSLKKEAQEKIQKFKERLEDSVSSAVQWDSYEAVKAEQILAIISAYEKAPDNIGFLIAYCKQKVLKSKLFEHNSSSIAHNMVNMAQASAFADFVQSVDDNPVSFKI